MGLLEGVASEVAFLGGFERKKKFLSDVLRGQRG